MTTMMTQSGNLPDRPTIYLLDARAYPEIAARAGIHQSARTLVMSGRLCPVVIGYRTYFRWMDVLEVMPDWARERYARLGRPPVVPTQTDRRYGEALSSWMAHTPRQAVAR